MTKPRISPHIASRLLNTALAVKGDYLTTVLGALQGRGVPVFSLQDGDIKLTGDELKAKADSFIAANGQKVHRPYGVRDGVAYIPVEGSLAHKTGNLTPYSGMTGYDGIRANLDIALMDDSVHAIALDLDSPGGEVSGCFALSDYIFEKVRGQKPIHALVNEQAYSACYAIASACDRIVVTETAGCGSIGVICGHCDMSKAYEDAGFKVQLFYSGKHKADGNPYEPISEQLSTELNQKMVELHQFFSSKVAKYRNMDVNAILETESRCYQGQQAVELGLADALMSPDDFHQSLATQPEQQAASTLSATMEKTSMSVNDDKKPKAEGQKPTEAAALTQADIAASATAERERIFAILNCDAAKDKGQLANTLANTEGMTLESAQAILNAAAPETAQAHSSQKLDNLMEEHSEKAIEEDEAAETSPLEQSLSLMDAAFGKSKK